MKILLRSGEGQAGTSRPEHKEMRMKECHS